MIDVQADQELGVGVFDREHVQKKLRLAAELFRFAFETKRFQLRKRYPDLGQRQINHRACALIERGCIR